MFSRALALVSVGGALVTMVVGCGREPAAAPTAAPAPASIVPVELAAPEQAHEAPREPEAPLDPTESPCRHDAMDDLPRGTVRASPVAALESSGTFDPGLLDRRIATRRAALLSCYERELPCAPQLAGTIRVTATIDSAGAVTTEAGCVSLDAAEPEGELRDCGSAPMERVLSCAQRVVRGFWFQADPPVGGSVRYTFSLSYRGNWQ